MSSPESARVQLRGKAAEGIQRWSTMQPQQPTPVAKDASPPLLSVSREVPTRGRPITELMSQLQQQQGEDSKAAAKKSSPWTSSVGKRLNFREQTRPHSRSFDESGEPISAVNISVTCEASGDNDNNSNNSSGGTPDSGIVRRRLKSDQSQGQPPEGDDREEAGPPSVSPPMPEADAQAGVRVREPRQYKSRSSTAPLPGGKLADRLQALQKSGEEGWKNRITPRSSPDRPISQIADLQSLLIREEADGWRRKQPPASADETRGLTVRGRLGDAAAYEEATERLKALLSSPARRPLPLRSLACSPPPQATAASAVGGDDASSGRPDSLSFDAEEGVAAAGFSAGNFSMSEAADKFFPSLQLEDLEADAANSFAASEPVEPLADIEPAPEAGGSDDLVQMRRRPMPQNRRRAQKNPVRARAEIGAQRESTPPTPAGQSAPASATKREEKAQSQLQPQSQVNKGLAKEAIQGLQAKVDLDAISLQRANPDAPVGPYGAISRAHKSLMLVQVKGRRYALARLVPPRPESLSSGDCYLLVCRDAVFLWQGALANVLESAKAAELAKWVAEKRALGYAGESSEPLTLSSGDVTSSRAARFWRLLGCEKPRQARDPLTDAEDAVYEQLLADTNAFYRVDATAGALVPLTEHWGRQATHRLLEGPEAVVCDFGSEIYLWCAKQAGHGVRRLGVKLAHLLFDSAYDYSQCLVSPLDPRVEGVEGGEAARGARRPEWCLLGKVNECGETVLFREKFLDWPDTRGLIGQRVGSSGGSALPTGSQLGGRPLSQSAPDWQLNPCDPADMLAAWKRQESACLELEGCRLGRGGFWTEVTDGLRRSFQLETLSVRAWLVTAELERRELPAESLGQLHSRCICLVRWQYRVMSHGGRLGGSAGGGTAQAVTGRDRCAYFYWQGGEAGQKEKGAGALLTVQLDEERCPQLHVSEGEEPPAFARIFQGSATIYSGSRVEEDDGQRHRRQQPLLFLVRGHDFDESLLVEVPCCRDSLRPRGCFLLVLPPSSGKPCCSGHLWQGRSTAGWYRDIASRRAAALATGTPREMGFGGAGLPASSLKVERQGGEAAGFWQAIGGCGDGRAEAEAEAEAEATAEPQPMRVFKFSSATRSGELQFGLVPDPGFSQERASPFPCQLGSLRALPQPANAFVLFDCGSRLYLWQGWNPAEAESTHHTGSSLTRFESEKRAVLKTAIEYGKLTGVPPERQLLVLSGSEPIGFRQLFPYWPAGASQLEQPAASPSACPTLLSLHDRLCNLSFDLARLQRRPLPEGVDPSRLEVYLGDAEFLEAFAMSREEFGGLSEWRKQELKKALGLY